MKLDEVIKELSEEIKHPYKAKKMIRPDVLKLSREALIAWRQYRRKKAPANLYLLPGETKD